MKKNTLIIFDCDDTLWFSEDHDYISSVKSDFRKINEDEFVRVADQKKFFVFPELKKLLANLTSKNCKLGIASDNEKEAVADVLKLLDIDQFFESAAVNVSLWKGHCPKELMIEEIITAGPFSGILSDNVWWVDDKPYHEEAKKLDVQFCASVDELIQRLSLK